MPELSVAFDAETLEELETERRVLGFESRDAYVRWIVDRREAPEDVQRRTDGPDSESNDRTPTAADADGASRSTGNIELDDVSASLTPERIDRIPEDGVGTDATVLETVRLDRLDELSRRAVAETRSRLDRDVETGLEYRSTASLGRETLRSGADLVDLDALSVPGRSADQREQRRAVAGRAVALLRDEGRAKKARFVAELYDSHPVGYETADGWWTFLKGVFEQIDAIEGGDGSRVWRYVGSTRNRDA
ncbi:hypothetical protein [Natronococcus sp.]|uniref:hypothetical protein n=1 Tax=Natronococcus sp. TaxID=35747 RepID=UPI0025FB956F|nr:hypothetical protein [Natronococcus sp.]